MSDKLKVNMNEYLPLRDVVFNTLRQAILRGELKPGERLMEIQLAEKLGVPLERRNFTRPSDRAEDLSFTGRDLVVFGMPTYAGKLPNKMLPYVQQ